MPGRKSTWEPPDEMRPFLEYREEKVRCNICRDTRASGVGRWINKKGLKDHLNRQMHLASWDTHQKKEQQREAENAEFARAYDNEPEPGFPAFSPSSPPMPPAMFPDRDDEMDVDQGEALLAAMPGAERLMEDLGQLGVEAETPSPEATRALLEQEYERLLVAAFGESQFDEDGLDGQLIGADQPKSGPDDDDGDEDLCDEHEQWGTSEYHPYPSRAAMLLDVLDNLPRCRFTSAQMSLIIHLLRQLGVFISPIVLNIPSLKGLRKMQNKLQATCGDPPLKIQSPQGNIFYMNDIRDSLARDMANPLVAPHMHFYPELVSKGSISETYQAERWMEYTPDQLTPMFSKGHKRFWIEELARCADGTFVIPHTWIIRDGILTSDASVVKLRADGRWYVEPDEIQITADDLEFDYDDISGIPAMPNAMRGLVEDDEDLYVIMVSPWADDVSGNRSKQYNKHMNMYIGNGCLPGFLLQQEFHVHYVSSSPYASAAEQFAAFRDHAQSTETDPVKCYNAATGRVCRFIIRVPGLPADNPQQSEEASHMGVKANYPCRKCHWGGTTIEKETEQTYHECHLAGAARNAEEIRQNLHIQLKLATQGNAKAVGERQRSTGTKDKITQYWVEQLISKARTMKAENPRRTVDEIAAELSEWLQQQPGDKMNPLLDIAGLDPSQDTPVELLHTILLGVIKYIWHHMNTSQWSDSDRHLLAIRLQSTDLSGLTVPPIRAGYMIQYKNNLIGKHFKTLMQTLTFHVHQISTPEQFALIKAAGDLGSRLWVPEIDDMDEYLAQLTISIANLLDAFDAESPLRILTKIKLHLLAHIPDDVRRFGPLIRVSTEIYEAFNGVFRTCSVFSNHLAPSRDISRKFASMDRVKHVLCGGYWQAPSKAWIQAGDAVQDLLQTDVVLQRHLGWVSPAKIDPGSIKPISLQKKPAFKWTQCDAAKYFALGEPPHPESIWRAGHSLTTNDGDKVAVKSWVVAYHEGRTMFGRIHELLAGSTTLVTLEQFIFGGNLHPIFLWPVLRRPSGEEIRNGVKSFVVLEARSVQFVINSFRALSGPPLPRYKISIPMPPWVQHDCRMGSCKPAAVGRQMQERKETTLDKLLIKHSEDDHFILNMSALHNFVKICRVLPTRLTHLKLLYPGDERVKFHAQAAVKARAVRQKGREKTAAKRRANAEAKKKEAEEAEEAAREAEEAARVAENAAPESEEQDEDSGEDSDVEEEEEEALGTDQEPAPGGRVERAEM
ncbi:hypothetical protein FB45DRAFT_1103391 [Roridomyces roridus]|uniref:Uncharacterized protein n=1 Tax=Roridomyces roridus TaxID=1738132 RepID=A0AAD7BE57_9AGAR|nr:hypothetical protein FB45DRAFT_1103391 [Roridomyces roridus]